MVRAAQSALRDRTGNEEKGIRKPMAARDGGRARTGLRAVSNDRGNSRAVPEAAANEALGRAGAPMVVRVRICSSWCSCSSQRCSGRWSRRRAVAGKRRARSRCSK